MGVRGHGTLDLFVPLLLENSPFEEDFSKIDGKTTVLLGTSPPLTEVSRALRARNAEKVSKMCPGASGPGTPKSLQKVSGTGILPLSPSLSLALSLSISLPLLSFSMFPYISLYVADLSLSLSLSRFLSASRSCCSLSLSLSLTVCLSVCLPSCLLSLYLLFDIYIYISLSLFLFVLSLFFFLSLSLFSISVSATLVQGKAPRTSIFATLDEECRVPGGNDKGFCDKIRKEF